MDDSSKQDKLTSVSKSTKGAKAAPAQHSSSIVGWLALVIAVSASGFLVWNLQEIKQLAQKDNNIAGRLIAMAQVQAQLSSDINEQRSNHLTATHLTFGSMHLIAQ